MRGEFTSVVARLCPKGTGRCLVPAWLIVPVLVLRFLGLFGLLVQGACGRMC